MARRFSQHNYAPAGAVTAAGNTGTQENSSQANEPILVVLISVGTVTGTTPSLTPVLEGSADGTNWFTIASGTAITATGAKQRIVANPVVEPFVRVSWATPSGTTPSFSNLSINFVFNQ